MMAENSKIEWCHDSWNPWVGCAKVSKGCQFCYAERDFDHRRKFARWGVNGTRVVTSDANWRKPLAWNRAAEKAGERRKVFCASLADVFENRPDLHAPRARLFDLIRQTPNLYWLLLTKRPEDIMPLIHAAFIEARESPASGATEGCDSFLESWLDGNAPKNVWLGTSVENQEAADERIPHLLRVPAAVRFLSVEPMLGPVDLGQWLHTWRCGQCNWTGFDPNYSTDDEREFCPKCGLREVGRRYDFLWTGEGLPDGEAERRCLAEKHTPLDWVIAGGESGPNARPMHPDWARGLRDQCQAAGVPFFFKQWGEWKPDCPYPFDIDHTNKNNMGNGTVRRAPGTLDGNYLMRRYGKKAAGRLLDGREWNEFPEVQQ